MVTAVFQGPSWFFGVDAIFQGIAMIVSLGVFLLSYQVYRISKLQRYKFFTVAFLSLTLAYLLRTIIDIVLSTGFREIFKAFSASLKQIVPATNLFLLGYGLHIFLALFGYFLLAIIALKVNKRAIAALIGLLLFVSIIFSGSYYTSYYVTAFILLGFIAYKYQQNYREQHSKTRLCVFLAFAFLALAHLQFLLVSLNTAFYVSAYLTLFVGSLSLFLALYMVMKK